ncbi:hypothetical protein D3C76_1474420 [compost metagenome]
MLLTNRVIRSRMAKRLPPPRMSSHSSGTITTSADTITLASNSCSTTRSQVSPVWQYSVFAPLYSSPEVVHRLMVLWAKRFLTLAAIWSMSRCGEMNPVINTGVMRTLASA